MANSAAEITLADVLWLLLLFERNGIPLVIDGGWAVDAVVGRQTRAHADLDIAIEHKDAPRVRAVLEAEGFRAAPRDDTWECNFVLGDSAGREVDIHSYTFDEAGAIVHGVPYPFDSLKGSGTIGGRQVSCITPQWLVRFHTGYKLDDTDYRDMHVLCEHLGIPMPAEYADFVKRDAARGEQHRDAH